MSTATNKILQRSVVTQTVLGRLTTDSPVANFIWHIWAKNYESWLAVDSYLE